jgi:hypothetical protein
MGAPDGSSCEAVNDRSISYRFPRKHRLNAGPFKNFPAPPVRLDFDQCHRCASQSAVNAALAPSSVSFFHG